MIVYYLCLVMFMLGIYCLIAKKNIVRKIIGIVIIEYATNLFLVFIGYKHNGIAPIITPEMQDNIPAFAAQSVDPLPQALVLTSIVIGLGTLCLMVALAIRLNEKYRTFDTTEISSLKG
ncbi:MAG: NADH-quinone oxidoreductase subunit K [Acidobacteria bacterium]|nr:NADH-quinone oxidoreductase subunit K [Acidobacteriota bacterium]